MASGITRRIRILLADDHPLFLVGVRATLEADGGFEVVGEAHSGPEVLPLAGRSQPDVVLLDIVMPGIDGLGCLDRLRDRYPEIIVVMFADVADPGQINAAFVRGAKGFIVKSVRVADFSVAIRQIIEGTAYQALGMPVLSPETVASDAGLTTRELEILRRLIHGLSNKDIAAELSIAEQTVKFHLTSLYRKLGIRSRTQAARWAHENGIHPGDPPASPVAPLSR
ncbi:MAG TPA: response regulator transcription factor [Gaiellaceae bacterium]|jgi:DNA-binding NarL/FixJ family response regulator|nr:response regulator transcription factor [Gaiellaceae bacterium]